MTVAAGAAKAGPYTGNGSASSFAFDFKVFADTDIRVVETVIATGVETDLTLNTHYTVTRNNDQDNDPGGDITYKVGGVTAALPSTKKLTIVGAFDYSQPTDIPNGGKFYANIVEKALDRLTMLIKQLKERVDRAALVPVSSDYTPEDLSADLITLAAVESDISAVAAIDGDVTTVAGIASDVTTVAGLTADVTAVAAIDADVSAVAAIDADVSTVAANVADITNFADVYQGAKASDPTLRNDGSPLQAGDLYFNTTNGEMRVYGGTQWKSGTAGTVSVQRFSGDASATAFTLVAAPAGENNTQVYISGVYQQKDQYSVSGVTLTFSSAPPSGTDNIEVVTISTLAFGEADAALVRYTPAGTGAAETTVQAVLRETVSVKRFGAVGDGVTDDTAAIQAALSYAFANDKSLHGVAGDTYLISSSLIIPRYQNLTYKGIEVDGRFCFIKRTGDFPAFTSGYDNAGILTTNYGTTLDDYYSQGIRLRNFNFISASLLTEAAVKIQDWHQGCKVSDMTFLNCRTAMIANNCYYTTFDSLQSTGGDGAAAMLQWLGNINLISITNCVAVNSGGTGYYFGGGVTALTFSGNSIEGVANGVIFNNAVYDATIENNYIESFTDTAVKFNDYVYGAVLRNNYVNFQSVGTNYFIDYVPSPHNNIVIEQSNHYNEMASVAQLVKTLSTTVSYNNITIAYKPSAGAALVDLLVDNTKLSSELNWQQIGTQAGLKANVVNKYALGNYSGKMTSGYSHSNGFTDASSGSQVILNTKITYSDTQIVAVNVKVNLATFGVIYVKGLILGDKLFEFDNSAGVAPNSWSISNSGGFLQIAKAMPASILSAIVGEVRLL